MEPELEALIRLNLTRRIASRRADRLLEAFPTLPAACAAPEAALAQVLGPEAAWSLKHQRPGAVEAEVARAAAIGARIITPASEEWPFGGADEITDPPLLLYVRGDLPRDEARVAIVGAREASDYGRRMGHDLGRDLALEGLAVVSGLARGVDAAAHRGALDARGRTIGVLGCGIDRVFPSENASLVEEIVRDGGAIVSEFPLGTPPLAFHFPRRNRIVAGLSCGVVVVEATYKSGSLITAEWAGEQGRTVMAVPGRVGDPGSCGCLRLLKEGAWFVEDAADVLYACGLGEPRKNASAYETGRQGRLFDLTAPLELTPVEEAIYGAIAETGDATHIDDLCEVTGLPASSVFGTLTALELKRAVKAWPGKLYQRAR